MTDITFPEVHLFAGGDDELADTLDAERLFKELSNSANATLF